MKNNIRVSQLLRVDKADTISRLDLMIYTIMQIAGFVRSSYEMGHIPPQELRKRLRMSIKVMCGWANIEYDDDKSLTQNLADAMADIRQKKIIYSPKTRAEILTTALHEIIQAIYLVDGRDMQVICMEILYSLSHLAYNPNDLKVPNHQTVMEDWIEELIHNYYKHGVLPKQLDVAIAELKRDDKFASVLFNDIFNRINRNTNNIFFIEGEHGVGKSYTALALAMELDPDFDVKKQVVFSIADFISLCNRYKEQNLIGKAIVFDEIGTAASALQSWDENNVLFDQYLQLFRYLRLNVILTARDVSDAIRRLRKRITHFISVVEPQKCEIYRVKSKYDLNKDRVEVSFEPYEYEDEYNKYLLMFHVPRVPKEIAELYEKHRDEKVTSLHLKQIEEEVLANQNDNSMLTQMVEDFLNNYIDDEEAYITKGRYKGRISIEFLCEKYGIGSRRAKKLRKLITEQLKSA